MPTCDECMYYHPKDEKRGECEINGPTDPGRDIARCPSRTYRPKA